MQPLLESGSRASSRTRSRARSEQARLPLALREFEPKPWPVSLVYAGQGLLPLKLRAFLDFAAVLTADRIDNWIRRQVMHYWLRHNATDFVPGELWPAQPQT